MLILYNPVYGYMTGERPRPTLDEFVGMVQLNNIDIIRMKNHLPILRAKRGVVGTAIPPCPFGVVTGAQLYGGDPR
jgi:hypothetical protein